MHILTAVNPIFEAISVLEVPSFIRLTICILTKFTRGCAAELFCPLYLTAMVKGNFFIHSSNAKRALKYSWLVSNHILVNACTPDVGVNIKNTSRNLDAYSYVYNTTGTYKATFLAVNGNYKKTSSVIRQMNIKVVE